LEKASLRELSLVPYGRLPTKQRYSGPERSFQSESHHGADIAEAAGPTLATSNQTGIRGCKERGRQRLGGGGRERGGAGTRIYREGEASAAPPFSCWAHHAVAEASQLSSLFFVTSG